MKPYLNKIFFFTLGSILLSPTPQSWAMTKSPLNQEEIPVTHKEMFPDEDKPLGTKSKRGVPFLSKGTKPIQLNQNNRKAEEEEARTEGGFPFLPKGKGDSMKNSFSPQEFTSPSLPKDMDQDKKEKNTNEESLKVRGVRAVLIPFPKETGQAQEEQIKNEGSPQIRELREASPSLNSGGTRTDNIRESHHIKVGSVDTKAGSVDTPTGSVDIKEESGNTHT